MLRLSAMSFQVSPLARILAALPAILSVNSLRGRETVTACAWSAILVSLPTFVLEPGGLPILLWPLTGAGAGGRDTRTTLASAFAGLWSSVACAPLGLP